MGVLPEPMAVDRIGVRITGTVVCESGPSLALPRTTEPAGREGPGGRVGWYCGVNREAAGLADPVGRPCMVNRVAAGLADPVGRPCRINRVAAGLADPVDGFVTIVLGSMPCSASLTLTIYWRS